MGVKITNGIDKLTANNTVNLDNTMSAAQFQAAIDEVPLNLNGFDLYLDPADGTYSYDTQISIPKFYGGNVYLRGNQTEDSNTLHTDQAVIFDFNASDGFGFSCQCPLFITNIKLIFDSATGKNAFEFFADTFGAKLSGCFCQGDGVAAGRGVVGFLFGGFVEVAYTYFSNMLYSIEIFRGKCTSVTNDDTGTQPDTGLRVALGATLCKSGTQPTGSTANESGSGSNGALIR